MGERVSFASNGGTCEGYLADGGGPGVIVIQEWWGLVPHIQDVADRFAAQDTPLSPPTCITGARRSNPTKRAS
ncbi:MAG: hypothetical protein RIU67_429 [Actinomycetota bacterium]